MEETKIKKIGGKCLMHRLRSGATSGSPLKGKTKFKGKEEYNCEDCDARFLIDKNGYFQPADEENKK